MIVRLSHRHSTGKPAKDIKDTLNAGVGQHWINIPNKIDINLDPPHYMDDEPMNFPPYPEGTILTLTQE